MAQRAMVTGFTGLAGTANLNEMKITFHVCLLEEQSPGAYEADLFILSPWADTLAQIKTRVQNAILAEAGANGYTTLTSANILMPSIQKG